MIKTLHCMGGLPASGKTTWLDRNAAGAAIVVSPDSFMYLKVANLPGRQPEMIDIYAWTPARVVAAWRKAFARLQELAEDTAGCGTVYFDATLVAPKDRRKMIQWAHERGIAAHCTFMSTPLAECLHRNAARPEDRRVPEETIRRMHSKMTLPISRTEAWDALEVISYKSPYDTEIPFSLTF